MKAEIENEQGMFEQIATQLLRVDQPFLDVDQIRENTLGLTHPEVAALLEQYALLPHATQRDEQAAALETRARTIREQDRSTEGGAEPN